jgi:hypothetical protein
MFYNIPSDKVRRSAEFSAACMPHQDRARLGVVLLFPTIMDAKAFGTEARGLHAPTVMSRINERYGWVL